jgi:leader peptidase (prepilin peptidase)/N-methyltransferase
MVISVYDIRHKIIPSRLVNIFTIVSFVSIFMSHSAGGPLFITPSLMTLLSGPLLALPFALLWLISRGRWMGLGDARLIVGIGWILGPSGGVAALMLAFWIGTLVSLAAMLFSHKRINMKTEIPFGPFLVLGMVIAFLCNLDVYSLVALFHL